MPSLDLIIPLGPGSKSDNDELRILLRSAELHAHGLQRVVVVTQTPPSWLNDNAIVVDFPDLLKHNKDGNMITKVIAAINTLKISGDFILAADDNVFVQDVELDSIPMLYNNRGKDYFTNVSNRWHARMVNTFNYFEKQGIVLNHNFEVHAPQKFNAKKIMDNIRGIDYKSGVGLGIYTLFRGICGEIDGINSNEYKVCYESIDSISRQMNKMFAGYNDASFLNGLREKLFDMFETKSKYER